MLLNFHNISSALCCPFGQGLWQAETWTDKNGNLGLFSGWAYTPNAYAGVPNDVWQFNPSSNEWAWMGDLILVDGGE